MLINLLYRKKQFFPGIFKIFMFKKSFSAWKDIQIPVDKLEVSFSRASGAGGQNVNKLNTKVEFRFNVDEADWINEDIKIRLKELFPNKINNEGEIIVTSQEHRTQEGNKKEGVTKLQKIVYEASIIKKERIIEPIVEPEHKRDERIKEKKLRSKVKNMRNSKDDRH
jgi:peptidyl-tRNA hydrolase ICT1